MPDDKEWILWSQRLAKKYIDLVCGDAPAGSRLDIMWHDHELGSYPSLGVWSEYEPPWDYINACERALEVFDEAVAWHDLKEHFEEQLFAEEDEEDEDEDANDET
jgi:hypothetical protein